MAFSVNNAPLAIGANVTPLNTPLENQIGMVKLQQVKQLAIDQEKQRQTADAFQKALQTTSGDYDSAADLLDKQGYDTLGLRNSLADYRDKLQKGATAHLAALKTENEMMSSAMAGVDSQEKWDAIKPLVSRIDPEFAKQAGDVFVPDKFSMFKNIGVTAEQQHKMAEDALQSFAKGDKAHGLALAVAGTTNDEDLKGALQYAQVNGAPAYLLQKYQGVKWSPELVAAAKTEAIGPEKSAELADKAADNARQDARNAQIVANENANLGLRRQEVGISAGHLALARQQAAAGGGVGTNQPPSDSVRGYMDDIISGAFKLTDVPAAGGMRNAVVGQLKKEGYDLNKPLTAQAQARVDLAKLVLPQVGEVREMAKKMNALGLMGTVGGRWRALASGESAADAISGLTPQQKQLIGQFVAQADLLSSGTAMTHFGARAGGAAVDAMRKQLDPKNKSLDVYLGDLQAAESVLGGYARGLPGATKQGGEQAAPTSGAAPAPVSTVRMRAPNGQMKDVPADRVDFYKSKGAVVVK